MTARHIWNHFQPWVENDIRTLTSCLPAEARDGPYVGLHIRRGDKLASEAALTPAEDYLNVTVTELLVHYQKWSDSPELFMEGGTALLPEDINGVHVASDDDRVVDEIRTLVNDYLPNVRSANVIYTASGKVSQPTPVLLVTRAFLTALQLHLNNLFRFLPICGNTLWHGRKNMVLIHQHRLQFLLLFPK